MKSKPTPKIEVKSGQLSLGILDAHQIVATKPQPTIPTGGENGIGIVLQASSIAGGSEPDIPAPADSDAPGLTPVIKSEDVRRPGKMGIGTIAPSEGSSQATSAGVPDAPIKPVIGAPVSADLDYSYMTAIETGNLRRTEEMGFRMRAPSELSSQPVSVGVPDASVKPVIGKLDNAGSAESGSMKIVGKDERATEHREAVAKPIDVGAPGPESKPVTAGGEGVKPTKKCGAELQRDFRCAKEAKGFKRKETWLPAEILPRIEQAARDAKMSIADVIADCVLSRYPVGEGSES